MLQHCSAHSDPFRISNAPCRRGGGPSCVFSQRIRVATSPLSRSYPSPRRPPSRRGLPPPPPGGPPPLAPPCNLLELQGRQGSNSLHSTGEGAGPEVPETVPAAAARERSRVPQQRAVRGGRRPCLAARVWAAGTPPWRRKGDVGGLNFGRGVLRARELVRVTPKDNACFGK